MIVKATSVDANKLMLDAALVFSKMEENGIRVDVDYCQKTTRHLERQIARIDKQLLDSDVYVQGRQAYGSKFNFTDDQLRKVLFDVMGFTPVAYTDKEKTKPSMAAVHLQELKIPALEMRIRKKKLEKVKDTYLANFMKEAVDGIMHPFFDLHKVITFRSSSSAPNFQNIPNRDPEIQKLCRQALIARPGRRLCCIDFSGVEVRIGTAYHKDPMMIKYIEDPTTDMHRDMAKEIYLIDDELWDWISEDAPKSAKRIRHSGKNEFVFPEFYGDWYKSCAQNLWNSAHQETHVLPDGTPLFKYLAEDHKIKTLSQFEDHMESVEHAFWHDRFPVYNEWKDAWYAEYCKKGYFDTLTGFRCQGIMSKNDATNYPTQGSAFHCTLFSAIEVQKVIDENNLKSQLIGQIHDEVILDMDEDERPRLQREIKDIMTNRLREQWKWINVPIDVEIEITPINGSLYEKKEIEI